MKPIWIQALIWIAAALAAVLMALANPDGMGFGHDLFSHGATAPR
jgi:hypothetical protein